MLDQIRQLYAHMKWADDLTLNALRAAQSMMADQHARALGIYAHVLGAEHVWLTRLKQEPATVAVWPDLDVEGCAALGAANARLFDEYLEHASERSLAQTIPYKNSAGVAFESVTADILMHLALHGTYHRGQVAVLLRDGGAVPNPTDYIAFIRGAPAATRVS